MKQTNVYPTITGALCANSHPGSYSGQDAFNDMLPVIRRDDDLLDVPGYLRISEGGVASNLMARDYKDGRDIIQEESMDQEQQRKYVLRRLTPTECARLQGFPDWWTDGAGGSDSSLYRMWGNGIALPCACDCLGRIAEEVRENG